MPNLGWTRVVAYDLDTDTGDSSARYRALKMLLEGQCGASKCGTRPQLSVWEVPGDAIKLPDLKAAIEEILEGDDYAAIYYAFAENEMHRVDIRATT